VPDGHIMALVQLRSLTKSCPKSKGAKDDDPKEQHLQYNC
jgi:hypothetical protein